MKLIDLRSDTVTKPDKNIIEEALLAELGDDEYGEDPTVNNLQEKCAELLGFESGLFVSSGLMGNQISLLIHNSPCLLYTSPSPRDLSTSRMPSSA